MKSYKSLARLGQTSTRPLHRPDDSRRGTVIIVVLAMLGMLVLIGFFILAFTASENQSATYFANSPSAKSPTPGVDADPFFNDVLRQIIIGPSITEKQSALYGGNKSLLPTMFGRDMATFNGQGVNWIWNTTTNQPSVDQNYDNVPDTPGTVDTIPLLQLNLSLAAQGGTPVDLNNFPVAGSLYPDPDTNTTYPDINSAFLSYDSLVPNPGSPALPTRVIIPSFHRPQLLRNVTATSATWYTDPATAKLVMFPHREHLAIDATGTVTATQRFVSAQYPDTTATPLNPFPIPNDGTTPPPAEGIWTTPGGGGLITYYADPDNDGVFDTHYMDFGFPLMTTPDGSTQFVAMAAVKIIDADALINLNVHGNRAGNVVLGPAPIPIPFGGPGAVNPTQFISHSNLGVSASEVNPEWALNARPNAGGPDFPGALAALQSALQQHVSFFRSPAQSGTLPTDDHSAGNYELANMEWWNILNGRPQLTPSASPTTIAASVSGSSLPGRWGENINHLDPNVLAVLGGTTPVVGGLGPLGSDPWPLPGTWNVDDNNNSPESGTFTDAQGIIHPPFVTPLDFFASGSWTVETLGSEGKARLLVAQGAQKFPQYANYFTNSSVLWTTFFNTTGGLMSGGGPRPLVDEPEETFTEPSAAATQADDIIFGPTENLGQLSGTDFAALGNPTRTASLAPFNMVANARAPQVRQRFTSTSWDLKSFGKEFLGTYTPATLVLDARRLWEFTDTSPGATGVGPFRFPPDFGTAPAIVAPALNVTAASTYPLRPDLAHLLWILADPKQKLGTTAQLLPQRPMSINGLTEQTQTGTDSLGNPIYTFRVRPLTPHPTATNPPATLTSAPIGTFPAITRPEQLTPGNVQQQEWLARYDRQRLARDIYTLLYLTGGGGDTFNYTTSNASVGGVRALYSEDQLQEMAQFAVNLVDQLDADSNITIFEYDKNLADGWNLDDNPYDSTADAIPPIDRGVVYGVERQQLALNEAMVAFSQQAVDTTALPIPMMWDHPDTQWDDKKQWAALYLELDNIGPTNVNFNNEQWEIAIKQSPILTPSTFYGTERRLIFQASQPQLVAGAAAGGFKPRLTIGGLIGSTGGVTYDQINSVSGNPTIPNPSYLVVDPNDTSTNGVPTNSGFDYQFPIVPRSAYVSPAAPPFGNTTALDLDLTQPGQQNQYWVVPPNGPSPTDPLGNADGAPITPPSGLSPGTQLLNFTDPIVEPTGTISSAPGAHIFPEASLVVRIELKRRVDPNRAPILPTDSNQVQESMDNPWIVVDYMDVPVSVLALKKTAPANASDYSQQIQYQLGNPAAPAGAYHQYLPTGGAAPLVSTERSQPLYHDFTLNPFKPTVPTTPNGPYTVATSVVYPRNGGATTLKASVWQGNSLGQDNDAAGFDPGTVSGTPTPAPAHLLYQPHYDRDFASIIELYNVPLWGPYAYLPSQPTAMNIPGQSSGNTVALSSGLTHLMGTRTNELGVAISGGFTPEVLGGTDFIPNDGALARQHYTGYGIAGYRFQHPEGSDSTVSLPTIDFTENRWHRWLGVVEVPTRSHRQLEEPPYQITEGTINGTPGFYRTPGKINLNTLRYPDVLAGLLDSGDVYSLSYSAAYPAGANFPANLSMPLSLPDLNGSDTFPAPSTVAGQRDWWTQFIMARDGIDPLATTALPNPGTGLPIPGMPRVPSGVAPPAGSTVPAGSHPFRGLGFSAFASANASPSGGIDVNRYNGTLDSTILRALPGDPVVPTTPTILPNSPEVRRGMFELGTANEHFADTVDYATKNRILSKILQNTTTRSNVFFVWIQVDFFQAKDVNPPNGVVRIGQKLATSPAYRGFFVVDRSQALGQMQPQFLPAVDPATNKFVFSLNQSFNYQSLVLFRQRIQ